MRRNNIKNEDGVAIVAALLILMLLSFVAVTMTDTTIFEKKMVRSEAIFKKAFYNAESASFEGVQKIENESSPNELLAPLVEEAVLAGGSPDNEDLLFSSDDSEPDNLLETLEKHKTVTTGDAEITVDFLKTEGMGEESEQDEESYRLVVQQPIQSGDSLALGQSRLYTYKSFGLSETLGGRSLIRMGYKKRF